MGRASSLSSPCCSAASASPSPMRIVRVAPTGRLRAISDAVRLQQRSLPVLQCTSLLSSSITSSEHAARLPCTHRLPTSTSCVATVVLLSASVTVTCCPSGTLFSFIRSALLRRTKQHEAPVSISMSTHLAPSICPRATIVLLRPTAALSTLSSCCTVAPFAACGASATSAAGLLVSGNEEDGDVSGRLSFSLTAGRPSILSAAVPCWQVASGSLWLSVPSPCM